MVEDASLRVFMVQHLSERFLWKQSFGWGGEGDVTRRLRRVAIVVLISGVGQNLRNVAGLSSSCADGKTNLNVNLERAQIRQRLAT